MEEDTVGNPKLLFNATRTVYEYEIKKKNLLSGRDFSFYTVTKRHV